MEKARVLLVEDNRAEANLTQKSLEKAGYEVIWVMEGTQAIKAAKTERVDCILLDLILPDINGTEVCRWLKKNEDTVGIPIIMLTVKKTTQDKVTGLQAGADDYLPKPYSEIELNARIYACLRNKNLQDELRKRNTELLNMLERVEVMAATDSLTELFNRRHFESIVEQEYTRTSRYGSPLTCLMIDIDYFKKVNDEHGHRAGDHVLREMAGIIKDNIREVDTAARWGGEEFVILLPQTNIQSAMRPARRILEQSGRHAFADSSKVHITVSIGIAHAPDPHITTGEQLIDASDLAMYAAKETGRNRIEVADDLLNPNTS
jgi:diguanylate cyclase (GGDEF)-like protein